jgi:hypothetical protein
MAVSYAVPADSGVKRRPTVVTLAGFLLFLVAILLIIGAILPLPSLSKVVDATREAYAGSTNPTPDQVASITRASVIVVAVLSVLLGVLFVILGLLVLRGSRAGRIVTWVFAGLGTLCTVCGLGGAGLSGRFSTGTTSNGLDMKTINDKINAARPSWLTPTTIALEAIALISLILLIILLALPAANAYFRKDQAVLVNDPGFPSLGYPQVPGATPYPPAPNAPPAPPAPGGPPSDTPPGDRPSA